MDSQSEPTDVAPRRDAVYVREATPADAHFVWCVNNEPAVRAQSVVSDPIPWLDHIAWYHRKLADRHTLLWIAMVNLTPVGLIRFDRVDSARPRAPAIVSVALASAARGRGLGKRLIRLGSSLACRHAAIEHLVAYIRPDNVASRRAFEQCGYTWIADTVDDGVALGRYHFEVET